MEELRAIAIDVGGTKTKACLVRVADGSVLAEQTRPTPCAEGGRAVLQLVDGLRGEIEKRAKALGGSPRLLGICLPELVTNDGEPASNWNFDWRGLDIQSSLMRFGKVHVDSDVRAAACAEGRFGAGRGFGIFVYVTISTGLSHTLVVRGEPYRGARGFAISFASSELVAYGGPDGSGELRQTLEPFAGGRALGQRYGKLTGNPAATAHDLFKAASTEPRAAGIVDSGLTSIASYLGQLINILDPEALVLGGGIGCDPAIAGRLAAMTRPFIFADPARGLPILPAELGENAPAIGVALLAGGAAPKP